MKDKSRNNGAVGFFFSFFDKVIIHKRLKKDATPVYKRNTKKTKNNTQHLQLVHVTT